VLNRVQDRTGSKLPVAPVRVTGTVIKRHDLPVFVEWELLES
jgi:hypothetical protein